MLSRLSLILTRRIWLIPLILAAVTLVMHHGALNSFWRFDDGGHLAFASCYAPWEYFFVPAITQEFSYANFTPWNPLTYDINLALFGLNPFWHYAHQLVSLWLAACLIFLLLRLWVDCGWAVFGAVLFLIGAPTVHIAQELRTSHYLEGLIFSCIAIYGFVRAIRSDGKHWLSISVVSYLLACTCKEIYVPIPILLLALPEGNLKKRFHFLLPFLVVTLLYLCWRAIVLGTVVGGYQQDSSTVHFVSYLSTILLAYVKLPSLLFCHNFLGYLALAALATLLLLNTSRRDWLLVLVAAGVLLLPLAPLTMSPGISGPDRYLFALWVVIALGVTILAGRDGGYLARSLCVALAGLIGVAAIQASRAEAKILTTSARSFEALYHFAFTHTPNDVILPSLDIPWDHAQFIYSGLLKAASNCGVPKPHPKLLSSVEAITAIDPKKVYFYRYDAGCLCVKDISSSIPEILSSLPMKRESRMLLIRFSPPPYRPRRDQPRITDINAHGGVVESINIVGETLEITGWARLRDDEPEQSIAIFVPALPVAQSLVSIERPDIANYLNNPRYLGAGFRVTLQFSSSTNAAYAAAYFCALKIAGGSFAPIENPANQECSILFQQYTALLHN